MLSSAPLFGVLCFASAVHAWPVPPAGARGPSLYDRLGGQPAVAAAVDELLKRVADDPRIRHRFIHATDLGHLRTELVDFICSATGGPCHYAGRDMRAAHAGMQITDDELAALVEDLVGALRSLGVGKAEEQDLVSALGALAPQVVSPPPPAAAAYDAALATRARQHAVALRAAGNAEAADLLETGIAARVRGQRSYADSLFSAAERLLAPGDLHAFETLFRAGGPERITTSIHVMSDRSPAQEPVSELPSEGAAPGPVPARPALTGRLRSGGKPVDGLFGVVTLAPEAGVAAPRPPKHRVIEQRHRRFAPRFAVVTVGSTVSFPNFDSFFHNVYSVSAPRPFDLGIYKNGETRDVVFAKEGIVHIACNLHADMAATLVVVAAPYYAVTDAKGRFRFPKPAPGRYTLKAWNERSVEPAVLAIQVSGTPKDIVVDLPFPPSAAPATDKFGLPRGKP